MIQARVTSKDNEIKTWSKPTGQSGCVFSVDLIDNQSTEIRATCFNKAAEKFFPIFERNHVYYISKGQIRFSKKFAAIKNEYEIFLDESSQVTLCQDQQIADSIPKMNFSFVPISQIVDLPKDELIDVIGIIQPGTIGDAAQIRTNNVQVHKRNLTLLDSDPLTFNLTLWRSTAETFDPEFQGVIAVKRAKISDYNRKTLSCVSFTHIEKNPDIPEAHNLRGWYDQMGGQVLNVNPISDQRTFAPRSSVGSASLGDPKTFSQIKSENLGYHKQDDFQVKGTIILIKREMMSYNACPTPKCNKKVTQDNNAWFCEKCNKTYENCVPRYILAILATDATGSEWLSAFNDVGVSLLGHTASELQEMKDNHEDAKFEAVFSEVLFKSYAFSIRAKIDTYQDQSRLKCTLTSCTPIDFVADSKSLIAGIQKLLTY